MLAHLKAEWRRETGEGEALSELSSGVASRDDASVWDVESGCEASTPTAADTAPAYSLEGIRFAHLPLPEKTVRGSRVEVEIECGANGGRVSWLALVLDSCALH